MTLLLIQALSNRTGVCAGTIRDYCRQGLLDPQRDSAGRRLFSEADIPRVRDIYLANTARRPTRSPSLIHVSIGDDDNG
jgi:DNA-binding transcriptional MerR regulator